MGLGGQTHKTPTTQWNSTTLPSTPDQLLRSAQALSSKLIPGVWLHPVWLHPKTQLKLFRSRCGGLLYSRAFFHPTYLCRARIGQEGSAEA